VKIPEAYQLFTPPVVLTSKDAERLSVYLAGWEHLAPILTKVNERDLERLVILELMGKQRWKLLHRLVMRLGRVQRAELEKRVRKCLRHHSK
jgi:hypothetical protein